MVLWSPMSIKAKLTDCSLWCSLSRISKRFRVSSRNPVLKFMHHGRWDLAIWEKKNNCFFSGVGNIVSFSITDPRNCEAWVQMEACCWVLYTTKFGPDFYSQGLKTMLDCILCLKVCAWLTLMNTAAKDDSFFFFSSTLEAWRDDISFEKIWNHSEICVDLEFTGWCFRGRSATWSCRDPDTEGKEVGTVSEYIILCMHLWSFLSAAFGLESVKNTLYILKILFPLSKSR